MSVDDLQTALQLHALGHLTAQIGASLTWSDCIHVLTTDGRVALLERLKCAGVEGIRDRQAVAKAVAIAARAQQCPAEGNTLPPTLAACCLPPATPSPSPPPGPLPVKESLSQNGCLQDLRALQFHGWKWGGIFLEIGVDDALSNNNTILLERTYGWRGICVDPNAPQISKRTCAFFQVALASRSGRAEFCMGGPFSGLASFVDSETHNRMWHDMAKVMPRTQVETRTPREVLVASGAPAVIDYMSLDVEGAEMEILRSFPFDEYTVLLATVETNDDPAKEAEMRAFMRGQGYTFLGHAARDDYYAYRPAESAHAAFTDFLPALDYYAPGEAAYDRRRRTPPGRH